MSKLTPEQCAELREITCDGTVFNLLDTIDALITRVKELEGERICTICKTPTDLACSDCRIDLATTVFVCQRSECLDEHEKKCPDTILKASNLRVKEQADERVAVYEDGYEDGYEKAISDLGADLKAANLRVAGMREAAAVAMDNFAKQLVGSLPMDERGSLNCRQYAKAIRTLTDEAADLALRERIRQELAGALKEAVAECIRHAQFCCREAENGGDWKELIIREAEAKYLAERLADLESAIPTDHATTADYGRSKSQDKRLRLQGKPEPGGASTSSEPSK